MVKEKATSAIKASEYALQTALLFNKVKNHYLGKLRYLCNN